MTQAMDTQEPAVTSTDDAKPSMVLFSDEEGLEIGDDVELISLTSTTLGAMVARRC